MVVYGKEKGVKGKRGQAPRLATLSAFSFRAQAQLDIWPLGLVDISPRTRPIARLTATWLILSILPTSLLGIPAPITSHHAATVRTGFPPRPFTSRNRSALLAFPTVNTCFSASSGFNLRGMRCILNRIYTTIILSCTAWALMLPPVGDIGACIL